MLVILVMRKITVSFKGRIMSAKKETAKDKIEERLVRNLLKNVPNQKLNITMIISYYIVTT